MASNALGRCAPIVALFLLAFPAIPTVACGQATPKNQPSRGIPIRLPTGLVITFGGTPGAAVDPDSVVLPSKEYKELLERIDKLQAVIDAQQIAKPRVCEMEGKLEQRGKQTIVRLKTTFRFTTTRVGTTIYLGCQRAQASEAKLADGSTPLLSAGEDGLRVQIEKPGNHELSLELDLPVTPKGAKGAELGFEMGLPGSPITVLSFETPSGVRRYTLATRLPRPAGVGPMAAEADIELPDADRLHPGKGGMPLGPVVYFSLAWEDPSRKVDAIRTAEAEVGVTLGLAEIVTEAKLRLRGPGTEWKFTAPATADVSVGLWPTPGVAKPAELTPERAPNVVRPDAGSTIWKLVFREPTSADLLVTVTTRQDRPRGDGGANSTLQVGPYAVFGVREQSGTIRVKTLQNWKAAATLHGDTRREPEDGSGDQLFRYRMNEVNSPPKNPPLELSFSPIVGVVQATVRHELRLTESSWQLRSEISVSPTRAEVEYVDFEVPVAFRASLAEPREIVEELVLLRETDPRRRVYRAKLAAPKRASFSFTLEGDYPHRPNESTVSIPLPRLLGLQERSTEVIVLSPPQMEIRGSFRTWEGDQAGSWETPFQREATSTGTRMRGTSEKPIASTELSWKLAPINATVRSEADVDLEQSRIRVTQRLTLQITGKPPVSLRLKTDRAPSSLRVNRGTLVAVGAGYDLFLPLENPEKGVVLQYVMPRSQVDRSVLLPLLQPDGLETLSTVRVWTSSTKAATLFEPSDWRKQPVEIVEERSTLPSLVLQATNPESLPKIVVDSLPDAINSPVQIERSRIEVRLTEQDAIYRANYWVRSAEESLEFAFPTSVRFVEVYVQGKRLAIPLGSANEAAPLTVAIPLINHDARVTRLEFRYRGPADELVYPVAIRPTVGAEIEWLVSPRAGWIGLIPGDAVAPWSPSAFLKLMGAKSIRMNEGVLQIQADNAGTITMLQRPDSGPLVVQECPRSIWLLGWSLGAFGLFGAFSLMGRYWVRTLGVLFCLTILLGSYLFPQPVAQAVFAAIPGLIAFATLLLVAKWAKARYRRRVERSIGFARPTSSLARPPAARAVAPARPADPTSRKSGPSPVGSPSS